MGRRSAFLLVAVVLLLIAWFVTQSVDARTWSLLENTLLLGAGANAIALPIGITAAVLIHRTNAIGRRVVFAALIGLLFVPLYLQAAGWDAWFGRQGWIWSSQGTHTKRLVAAIWIHGLAGVPWVMIILGTALHRLNAAVEEMAAIEMSARQVLFRVTLPLSFPAILLAAWWVFAVTSGEMTVTDIYQVRTFAEEVYTNMFLSESGEISGLDELIPHGTWFLAAALALSLLPIMFLLPAQREWTVTSMDRTFMLRGWQPVAVLALTGIVLVCVGIPLLNLCLDAGLDTLSRDGVISQTWSPSKFARVLFSSPWIFRREFAWTGVVSGVAATISVAVAFPLAWVGRTRGFRGFPALMMAAVAAAIPGPIVAISLIRLLNREDSDFLVWLYDRTVVAPALASAFRTLPVAIAICWWGLRTLNSDVSDLGRLDGLGWFGSFRHIVWAQRKNYLFAAWLASFAYSAGDLSASFSVTPPGISTVSHRVFVLLHAGVDDHVAGICLVSLLLTSGIALATMYLLRSDKNSGTP